ncbi:hypothetical protein [Streptomyces sp. NPDC046978]|uniref:hypothetical protein n=1 Tax=Streptomyces sp. NPDC046978 TaxID=3154704 RepID=UPI0033E70B04
MARTTAVNSTITTSSLACSVPAGTASGDVMVALISRPSSGATVSTPSGWSILSGFPVQNTNGTTFCGFYKVAASEPASYTFAGSTGKWCIAMATYRGVDNGTPIHASAAAIDTTSRAAHASPSVTTTVADCWILTGYCDRGTSSASTWATPSGLTSRSGSLVTTGTSNNSLATFDTNADEPTGSYSYSATASAAQNNASMCTVALAPASAVPAPPVPAAVLLQAASRAALR